MNYDGAFFYSNVFIEIRNSVLFIIILWRNYTNKLFIFRDYLNFTAKCIGGQIKAFSFLFCTTSDAKNIKAIYRVIVKQQVKRGHTHPIYLHVAEQYEKVESINT